jgi:hypothetical protein
MSNADLTSILFILLLLVGLSQLLGHLFVKLRQPKVVGEIIAGVVLGPALLGRLPFGAWWIEATKHQANVLNFVYWMGLLLLMFLSGAEMRQLFGREERREVAWLGIVGTGIPFALGLALGPWLIRPALAGPNGNRVSLHHYSGGWRGCNLGTGGFKDLRGFENTSHPLRAAGSRSGRPRRHCAVAGSGGGHHTGRKGGIQSATNVFPPHQHSRILRAWVDHRSPNH